MDSFQNPVGEGQHDPYERYRIEQIERDKERNQRSFPNGKPPQKKWGLAAYLLTTLKKIVSLFESSNNSITADEGVLHDLLQLKNAFEILKKEDRSEDVQFLNELSNAWLHLLEDGLTFPELKTLVKSIQNYPKAGPHTLGYYLSEYAGQKWIPFPYMELVQKIHIDFEKNPESSPLTGWIEMIHQLEALLQAD